MEGRLRILFLRGIFVGVIALGIVDNAWAVDAENDEVSGESQPQVIQPRIERRRISVDQVNSEDFEIGFYAGLLSVEDFGANTVIGARVAYHLTEGVFFEAAYGESDTSETSYEVLSGGAPLLSKKDRHLSYYNASIGYNLLPGESFLGKGWAFNNALYVIAGVGSTKFAGENLFTVNVGSGFRFLATDWLAVHIDVRDHIFKTDILGEEKQTHNLEVHGGITVFF